MAVHCQIRLVVLIFLLGHCLSFRSCIKKSAKVLWVPKATPQIKTQPPFRSLTVMSVTHRHWAQEPRLKGQNRKETRPPTQKTYQTRPVYPIESIQNDAG